ncbi:MAG: flagellar hook-associated protein FlgK [Planctomycetes bacterium]|nr:flagellar hook-associated protein FlgK [Planctomycetota bacterium]
MFGFDTGLSALSAARLAIETVGNNLANATTPGYSRNRVLTATGTPTLVGRFYQGGGVRVAAVDRVTDDLLVTRVREQSQEVERRNVILDTLLGVEAAFGEPSTSGLSAQLGSMFDSLSSLATAPEDISLRKGVVLNAAATAEQFRRIRSDVGDTLGGVRSLIKDTTADINRITESIAAINTELAKTQGFQGGTPNALLDRQGQLLDELAQYVDISVTDAGAGRVNVQIGGQMVVNYNASREVSAQTGEDGEVDILLEGSDYPLDIRSGKLKGFLELSETGVGERVRDLDALANALILNVNRVHSTGVPAGGGFEVLRSHYPVQDQDGDGSLGDELIGSAGLPFEIQDGRLWVSIVDEASGAVSQTRIDIDPQAQTVADLVQSLNAVSGLNASLDATGRLSLAADPGSRFHFGGILTSDLAGNGSLGSSQASLATAAGGPFNLSAGASFDISVDGGANQTITFSAAQFADISSATAEEVAAAINGSLVGAQAEVVGDRLVIRSASSGATSGLSITDGSGSPAAALGLATGPAAGQDNPVAVTISGEYSGDMDERVFFQPVGDGTIGLTPGLQIQAVNAQGKVLAVLDVGPGYSPGDPLEVVDGIKVAFGAGAVSASTNEYAFLDAFADGDDSDVLAAFGINSFFVGTSAEDIEVADDLRADSSMLAGALGPAASDNRNVVRLLALRDAGLGELGDLSAQEYYSGIVADVGQTTSRAQLNYETEVLLRDSFENRLESVRGVSVDEELAALQRHEQAYQAAARYISAINEVTQVLFNL